MSAFRLLDERAGWSLAPDGATGLALQNGSWSLGADSAAIADQTDRDPAMAGLVADDSDLVAPAGTHGLRRLGPCDTEFTQTSAQRPAKVVIVCGGLVAVLLAHRRGTVQIFDVTTGHLIGEADVRAARGLACAASDGSSAAAGTIGVVDDCRKVVVLDPSGLVCRVDEGPPSPPARFPEGTRTWPDGFHLPGRGSFDRRGRRAGDETPPTGTDQDRVLVRGGRLHTDALDSGLPGCRWHRLRVDAEVPSGTTLRVAVATTDSPPGEGVPNAADWVDFAVGAVDVLLPDRPGRWAYVRVTLTGDGSVSPVLHGLRLDLPRHGPADALPEKYLEDPRARDFTERLLGLFGSFIEQIDDVIARRAALLDAEAMPDDALGWLAGTIGLGFEPEMPAKRRRRLIAAAPDLYRRRGTPHGLVDTLRIALGVDAVVEEPGLARPWGAVGAARLGGVRLFGRSAARVRLGTSRMGRSRLVAGGDPDLDAVRAGAQRARVHVGPIDDEGRPVDLALVARVVRSQSPANVLVSVIATRRDAAVGSQRAGIDTVILAPAPVVVGGIGLGRGARVTGRRASGIPIVGAMRVAASEVPYAGVSSVRPAMAGPICSDNDERSEP